MFGFLKRLTQGGAPPPDDDPEVLQEMEDGVAAVAAAEAAGALPVLDTQHRAIGTDACHLAVPASMPDHADAFGKLFVTVGIGRINKAERHHRDVVIVSGGDSLVRFRCNSFGDAMLTVWMIQRLKAK